jgi:hypothetical protein
MGFCFAVMMQKSGHGVRHRSERWVFAMSLAERSGAETVAEIFGIHFSSFCLIIDVLAFVHDL